MKIKKCSDCNEILTSTNWYKNTRLLQCKKCRSVSEKKRYLRRRDYVLKSQKELRLKNKLAMIEEYGGKCSCCGENKYQFLTLEHINKDGAKNRRELGGSKKVHQWLRHNNYPKEGFTILCFNCNAASFFYGECPHKYLLLQNGLLKG